MAILGLLKEQQLHGYELKKRLTESLGPFSSVSFGSLYPALGRLEKAGAVRAVGSGPVAEGSPARPVPMTGSIAGEVAAFRARRSAGPSRRANEGRGARTRKVYAITDHGHQLFSELLEADAGGDDDRVFNLKLAFCRFLPPERRLRLLERRRAQLADRLARTRTSRRERLDTYRQSLIDHGAEAAERDISWLDRLIAIERQGGQQ